MAFGLSEGRDIEATVARRNKDRGVATCQRCGGLMVSELGFDFIVESLPKYDARKPQ